MPQQTVGYKAESMMPSLYVGQNAKKHTYLQRQKNPLSSIKSNLYLYASNISSVMLYQLHNIKAKESFIYRLEDRHLLLYGTAQVQHRTCVSEYLFALK